MSGALSRETVRIVPGRDEHGGDVFAFLVKRSYRFDGTGQCQRVEPPAGFLDTDVYWGDPATSSPRYEADKAPYKPATDVIVIGTVCAPGGAPTHRLDASIQVVGARKTIAVFGDRIARLQGSGKAPVFSDPQPFTELPLVYERAYGGTDLTTAMEFTYPRNPVGRGMVVLEVPGAAVLLPNFEDPADLLAPERLVLGEAKRWNHQPLPQGMGWFGKTWYPRMSYVGALPGNVDADETMREEALGLVPRNHIALGRQFRLPSFDVRFNNGASPGLALPHLAGDEMIRLLNLTPQGETQFRLPGDRPTIVADVGMGETTPEVVLHTVVIQPDQASVDLVWRGAVGYPGSAWLPHMKRLAGWVA
jgi:hypothetical protein